MPCGRSGARWNNKGAGNIPYAQRNGTFVSCATFKETATVIIIAHAKSVGGRRKSNRLRVT